VLSDVAGDGVDRADVRARAGALEWMRNNKAETFLERRCCTGLPAVDMRQYFGLKGKQTYL
jgi:hypothetical protein